MLAVFLRVFFERKTAEKHPLTGWLWLVFIYLVGLVLWGIAFDWRQTALTYHDWAVINMPRIQVIKEALTEGILPLHLLDTATLHNLTDRFLALPDVITTPQMLLLLAFDSDTFALLDILLHYSIATIGLLYIRKRFNLSLFVYAILFFLFNFNGYIIAHYSVGHATWAGYFLFPAFFLLIIEFIQNQVGWRWVAKVAFLSFYIILAGSQHHFTWMMLFLALLGLAHFKRIKWIMAAILSAGFLSAIRLLPPVFIIGAATKGSIFQFRSGYPGLVEMFSAFLNIRPLSYVVYAPNFVTGYWEYNYFIGLLGCAFLLFGLIAWVKDPKKQFADIILPLGILFLLCMGFLYEYTLFNLPLFASERVISRMISLPVSFMLILSAIYFQAWYDSQPEKTSHTLGGLGLLFLLNDLLSHTRIWSMKKAAEYFGEIPIQLTKQMIQNHPDPIYFQVLIAGLILTTLTAFILLWLVVREGQLLKRQKRL
jgi:hypothetical protein